MIRLMAMRTSGIARPDIKQTGFWWRTGAFSLWLRNHWLLTTAIFLGAAALVVIPRTAVDSAGRVFNWATWLLVGLGVTAAIAVVLDKVADHHSGKLDAIETAGQERAGVRAINRIVSLLEEVHELTFLPPESAAVRVAAFPAVVAMAAGSAPVVVGDSVRASYYPLEEDSDRMRSMTEPKSWGRGDEPITNFVERDDPNHAIWRTLAARDTECRIYTKPEPVQGLNWDERPYATFLTVPVKAANKVTFGMLTVNALNRGDLTELDRVCAIALARVAATAEAIARGHNDMGVSAVKEASRRTTGVQ
jgi:hypothetical protein